MSIAGLNCNGHFLYFNIFIKKAYENEEITIT